MESIFWYWEVDLFSAFTGINTSLKIFPLMVVEPHFLENMQILSGEVQRATIAHEERRWPLPSSPCCSMPWCVLFLIQLCLWHRRKCGYWDMDDETGVSWAGKTRLRRHCTQRWLEFNNSHGISSNIKWSNIEPQLPAKKLLIQKLPTLPQARSLGKYHGAGKSIWLRCRSCDPGPSVCGTPGIWAASASRLVCGHSDGLVMTSVSHLKVVSIKPALKVWSIRLDTQR